MMRGKHGQHTRGNSHYRWKPGGSVASNGYVKLRVGKDHPLADPNGYAYEHLVVWVAAGNRRPGPGEILHHLNENKTDNRIVNLELQTRGDHNRTHNAERGRDSKGRLTSKSAAGNRSTGDLLDGVQHHAWPRSEPTP